MLQVYQQTINRPLTFKGIGLHTGKISNVTVYPGKDDQGIVFKRIDLQKNNLIQANYKNVKSAKLCTSLENQFGAKISTVEHILAAFYIAGIDNAFVEIDNEEIPIMDGSAKNFLEILKSNTEIIKLSKKRKYLKIVEETKLIDDKREISIEPSNNSFEVDFQLNYENKIIGNQKNIVNFHSDKLEQVYEARTFCLYKDIEKIKSIGLAKGGSLDNALVVDEDKILNKGGLRNEKEFVNHKILDLAGDFLLSGYRIIGKVKCHQGGHNLSNIFLRKLLNTKSAYIFEELNNINIPEKTQPSLGLRTAVSA